MFSYAEAISEQKRMIEFREKHYYNINMKKSNVQDEKNDFTDIYDYNSNN
jgi:hypothetical protein